VTLALAARVAIPSLLQLAIPALLPALQRDRDLILHDGQVWRLVTALIVQDGGLIGLIFDPIPLVLLGTVAECLWGGRCLLALFFGTGILGQFVGLVLQPRGAGNSVGDFGIAMGLAVLYFLRALRAATPAGRHGDRGRAPAAAAARHPRRRMPDRDTPRRALADPHRSAPSDRRARHLTGLSLHPPPPARYSVRGRATRTRCWGNMPGQRAATRTQRADTRRGGWRRRLAPLPIVFGLAYALLFAGWVGGDPPFAAPDEWSHYLRTLGVADGHLIGAPYAYELGPTASDHDRRTYAWINDAARLVRVPPGLFIPGFDCNAGKPERSAACLYALNATPEEIIESTPVGNYQPLPYLLPALVIRLAHDPYTADRLGRAASALACWLCLALALRLLWNGRAVSLVGLLLALSPMVLFIGAALTPSGLEIMSGLLFAAALLRLWRQEGAGAGYWLVAGVAGATLALCRSTGPLYVAIDLLVFAALVGPRGLWGRVRARWPGLVAGGAIIAVGVVLSRLWERAYGSQLRIDPAGIPAQLGPALERVPVIMLENVGVFGSLDTVLPSHSAAIWVAALGATVALALLAGTWRERVVLAATALGNLAVIFAFSVILVVGTTFDVQGRHILPLVVLVPLLAGELLARRTDRFPARLAGVQLRRAGDWAFAALACGVGLFQIFAWYWNARRQGVGLGGKLRFFDRAEWYPPGGWQLWAVLVVLGAALLALPALLRLSQPRERADVDTARHE